MGPGGCGAGSRSPGGPDNDYGHGLIALVAAHAALSELPTCNDADADGYFAEEGCGTPLDCDDEDPIINSAACDLKRDDIDQDCNGVELALVLPALLWLHRRRDLRSASR